MPDGVVSGYRAGFDIALVVEEDSGKMKRDIV